jgi:hypothetical protein
MCRSRRYEYRIIKGDRADTFRVEPAIDKIELELTGLGLEGWRLVNTQQYTNMSGFGEFLFILERPLPEDEDTLDLR